MKNIFTTLFCLFIFHSSFSQDNLSSRINDEWYNKYGSQGLKIGDFIPDISLGSVINNYTGKTKFSDFKGKLLILDFWDTSCTSCIAAFPHMEELQKEFGDQIQIILVNKLETWNQIVKRQKTSIHKYKLPSLPCIVAEDESQSGMNSMLKTTFGGLLPYRGVPYHVWIDEKGKIALMGDGSNTYAEKIRDVLAGKQVLITQIINTIPFLIDKKIPYYSLLGSFKSTPVSFGSFITPYNNEINGLVRGISSNIDSATKIKSTRFINYELLDLYNYSGLYGNYFRNEISNKILNDGGDWWNNSIIFEDVDTLLFTTLLHQERGSKLKNIDLIKSMYCFEQILPVNTPDSLCRQWMIEDLNRYFSHHLGVEVKKAIKEIQYYAINRLNLSQNPIDLKNLIQIILKANPDLEVLLQEHKKLDKPWLMLNETGFKSNEVQNHQPKIKGNKIKTMEEFDKLLQTYGYHVESKSKKMPYMVIKKITPSEN